MILYAKPVRRVDVQAFSVVRVLVKSFEPMCSAVSLYMSMAICSLSSILPSEPAMLFCLRHQELPDGGGVSRPS